MKHTKRLIITLLFGVIMTFGSFITANASGAVVQSSQTENSVTISIDKSALTSYTITSMSATLANTKNETVQGPVTLDVNSPTYTFSSLQPGTGYYVTISYTYKTSYGSEYTSTNSYNKVFTSPGKVTGVNQVKWWYYLESVDFSWNSQGECKYEWIAYQGKKQVAKNTYASSSNSGSFKVKNNKLYTVKVRAYQTINGQTVYGAWSDQAYLFTQPMVKSISVNGSGKMTVKWNKISGVSKYTVYVSTKEKKGYKKVATVSSKKASATISKLNKKKFNKSKTYYVYIVANKKVGSKTYTSGRLYSTQYKKGSTKLMWSFSTK